MAECSVECDAAFNIAGFNTSFRNVIALIVSKVFVLSRSSMLSRVDLTIWWVMPKKKRVAPMRGGPFGLCKGVTPFDEWKSFPDLF